MIIKHVLKGYKNLSQELSTILYVCAMQKGNKCPFFHSKYIILCLGVISSLQMALFSLYSISFFKMFQMIIKLLIIKQCLPEHGQALFLFPYSPAAQAVSLPKAPGIKQTTTFWDPGKWRAEQRRQRFLTRTNLKTAPSLLVIFVPWQDLQKKKKNFFLHFQPHKNHGFSSNEATEKINTCHVPCNQ